MDRRICYHKAPILSIIVVFIGLLAICNSVAGTIWGYVVKEYPSPFPSSSLGVSGIIGPHQLVPGIIGPRNGL